MENFVKTSNGRSVLLALRKQYHDLNTLHNIPAAALMATSGLPKAREEDNEALTREQEIRSTRSARAGQS